MIDADTEGPHIPPRAHPERERIPGNNDTKIHRVAEQTQGLVGDIKDWVDLKIELTKLEIKEQIEEKAHDLVEKVQERAKSAVSDAIDEHPGGIRALAAGGAAGVLALIALVFVFAAGALALESVIPGLPGLGFLAVAITIAIIARFIWGLYVRPFIRKLSGGDVEHEYGKSIEQGRSPREIEGHGSVDRRALPGPEG